MEYKVIQNIYSNPVNVTYQDGSSYLGQIADPTVIKGDDGFIYIFSTHGKMFKSEDGCNFKLVTEQIFPLPTWGKEVGKRIQIMNYGLQILKKLMINGLCIIL